MQGKPQFELHGVVLMIRRGLMDVNTWLLYGSEKSINRDTVLNGERFETPILFNKRARFPDVFCLNGPLPWKVQVGDDCDYHVIRWWILRKFKRSSRRWLSSFRRHLTRLYNDIFVRSRNPKSLQMSLIRPIFIRNHRGTTFTESSMIADDPFIWISPYI